MFWRNSAGSITDNQVLYDDAGNEIAGAINAAATFTEPCIIDWNNDGIPDLIVVTSQFGLLPDGYGAPGRILIYRNIGTKTQYKFHFDGPVITQKGDTIRQMSYMQGDLGDVNGDGLFDIVTKVYRGPGNVGIVAYLNTGSQGAPQFSDSVTLLKTDGQPVKPDLYMCRFAVADWNGDGVMDLVTDYNEAIYQAKVQVFLGQSSQTAMQQQKIEAKNEQSVAIRFNQRCRRFELGTGARSSGTLRMVSISGRTLFVSCLNEGQTEVELDGFLGTSSATCIFAVLECGTQQSVNRLVLGR